MQTEKCPCTQVDCISANEIRTQSLQLHSATMASIQHAAAAQVHNSNFSQKMLETMAIKDFKEVDALESAATKPILSSAGA